MKTRYSTFALVALVACSESDGNGGSAIEAPGAPSPTTVNDPATPTAPTVPDTSAATPTPSTPAPNPGVAPEPVNNTGGTGMAPTDPGTSAGGASPSTGGTTGSPGGAGGESNASGGMAAAGAGGAESTGGAGGGVGFSPCPQDGSECRIMPLGDSLTVGVGTDPWTGYRLELFRLAVQSGAQITFVGSGDVIADDISVDGIPFPKAHEGYRGIRISRIQDDVVGWVSDADPHIVLLIAGTNDVNTNDDLGQAPNRLGALIDQITDTAPEALVVVSTIPPANDDSLTQRITDFNAAIPDVVAQRSDDGQHVAFVDIHAAIALEDDYIARLMFDRLHPNGDGYEIIANVWYEAIGPLLPR